MLEAKRLNKAVVPESLIPHPSPANIRSTRLAVHANGDASSCWVYIASASRIYKLRITGLTFSSVDPNYIYVQGVDYEVLCGQWREREKAFSFRGDSNWLGFSKSSNRDIVAGWCDSGSIFVADVS
ncbi:UNVERIFIED_CONTAM: hypothetical protein Scaly_1548900 [Sesamum calycinum]|uniref:DUF295 domain-containing protein n=1 Tax=Sesamum calycinum TaxID=2727403 RepID=A0AAW2P5Q1_9LAMI